LEVWSDKTSKFDPIKISSSGSLGIGKRTISTRNKFFFFSAAQIWWWLGEQADNDLAGFKLIPSKYQEYGSVQLMLTACDNEMVISRQPSEMVKANDTQELLPSSSTIPKRWWVSAIDDVIRGWESVVRIAVESKVDFPNTFLHGANESGKFAESIFVLFATFGAGQG
jgi:hypothetical protein